MIRGMRNRLAHDYRVTDKRIVWRALIQDVPRVLERLLADDVIVVERFRR